MYLYDRPWTTLDSRQDISTLEVAAVFQFPLEPQVPDAVIAEDATSSNHHFLSGDYELTHPVIRAAYLSSYQPTYSAGSRRNTAP